MGSGSLFLQYQYIQIMPTRLGSSLVEKGPGGAYEYSKRDTSSRAFARSRRYGDADRIGEGTYKSNPPLSITSLPLNINSSKGGAVPVSGSARIDARQQVIDLHLSAPYAKVRKGPAPLVEPFVGADDTNVPYAMGSGMNAPYIEQEDENDLAKKLKMPREQFYTYSRLIQRDRVLHKYEHNDERHYKHHVVPHYVKQDLEITPSQLLTKMRTVNAKWTKAISKECSRKKSRTSTWVWPRG